MAQTNVHVRTIHDTSVAVGWSGPRTVVIDRPESAGGLGIGFNGGELLLLALGACYTNDLYREASKRSLTLESVRIDVFGDWGGDPVRAQNVTYSVSVESNSSKSEVLELIRHTDSVAEVHNSLRGGTTVTLDKADVVQPVAWPRGGVARREGDTGRDVSIGKE